jgi:hypothetical protein
MATGTVEDSSPEAQSGSIPSSIPFKTNSIRHGFHEKEKHFVQSIRSVPQKFANPFLVTDRADEKQLCISSRGLELSDFKLLKTLGTGQEYLTTKRAIVALPL